MAAPSKSWVTIADNQVDADSPGDTILMTGIRDDLVHLRECVYTPGTHTPAAPHNHDGVNSSLSAGVLNGSVTPVKLSNQTAGDYLMWNNSTLRNTTSTSYVKLKETKLAKGGTYRIKFTITNVANYAYATIYRNGASVGTERLQSGGGSTTFSEDIAGWSSGDLMQIYGKVSGANADCQITNFQLYGATPGDFGSLLNY